MSTWYATSGVQFTITFKEVRFAFCRQANLIYIKEPWKFLKKLETIVDEFRCWRLNSLRDEYLLLVHYNM